MEAASRDLELTVATLLRVTSDMDFVPQPNSVLLEVFMGDRDIRYGRQTELDEWSQAPSVRMKPHNPQVLHTMLLVDLDEHEYLQVGHTGKHERQQTHRLEPTGRQDENYVAVLWAKANLSRSSAEDGSAVRVLQPFVPTAVWPPVLRRLVILCCEQSTPLSDDALCVWHTHILRIFAGSMFRARFVAHVRRSATATSGSHPPRIRPADLWGSLGLRPVGLRCATVRPDRAVTLSPGDLGVARSWRDAWLRGGRYLEWMLLGVPVAGIRDFAPIDVGSNHQLRMPAYNPDRALEYAAVATGWYAAALLDAAVTAQGGSDECGAITAELQALLEAAAGGNAATVAYPHTRPR